MKTYSFGTFYLGGRIDLLRLREHLVGSYPAATFVPGRQQNVLRVPLAAGDLGLASGPGNVSYEVVNYQFDNGFGQILFVFQSASRIPALEESATEFVLGQREIADAGMDYLRRTLNIKGLGEISELGGSTERRRKLKSETGINLLCLGLDAMSVNFSVSGRIWLVGSGIPDLDMGRAEDLSESNPGLVFAFGPERFWSPAETEDLTWDMVVLQMRESGTRLVRGVAQYWLEVVQRQLEQMVTTLAERNPVVWDEERVAVERFDFNFHMLATDARRFITANFVPAVQVVSRERWRRLSAFELQVDLANQALDEAHRAIERMTRPLDFREFQLLKTGVEEVEGRIMLLTILLVLMELFRVATEPGHWTNKSVLLGLVILIPAGFLLFESWRRSAIVRRGRALLARNRIERATQDIKDLEQEIEGLKKDDSLAAETQQAFLGELRESLERLKRRQAEYETELRQKRS